MLKNKTIDNAVRLLINAYVNITTKLIITNRFFNVLHYV